MKLRRNAAALLAALAPAAAAQSIRIVKFSEARPFQMGKVTSVRIISPESGAKRLTLNYSTSEPGNEFSQHVHDNSDDTILVLSGAGDLRQGDTRTPVKAGTCAFVPAGQIHGTITTAPHTIMISFQTPPDTVLYTGKRDSALPGAPPPKGAITPGAVRYVSFANVNGFFARPGITSKRVAVARRILVTGAGFTTGIGEGGEELLFVWSGGISVSGGGHSYEAGEKDTAFITGPNKVSVSNRLRGDTVVFEVQAPPYGGW